MLVPDPDCPESLRIFPASWTRPLPLADYFPADQPLEVDVGCGKGRFLLARASGWPSRNFLGIERMLRRVRGIDRKAQRRGLGNLRLLRMEAYYAVTYLIPRSSVTTYFVFFPDPWPKKRHHAHRLFSPAFMEAVHRTLEPGGRLHVATDHRPYFEEIASLLNADAGLEPCAPFVPAEHEQTDFERYYARRQLIHRVSVRRTG